MKKIILGLLFFLSGKTWASPMPEETRAFLKTLVNINTGTGNTSGADEVRALLIPRFQKLGFVATSISLAQGHKILGLDYKTKSSPELLLLGHLDTVFPVTSKFQLSTEEPHILRGPGVIDMKGGLVLILAVLEKIHDPALLSKIRIVINDDEEIGSSFSRDTLRDLAQGISSGLIFEPGLPNGAVVRAHAGVDWIELKVHGRAAHAGLEPEKGINACVELAHKLLAVEALSDPKRNLSLSPDVIEGGTKPNVICSEARSVIDLRYVRQSDRTEALKRLDKIRDMQSVFNSVLKQGPQAETKVLVSLPNMPEDATKNLFSLAKDASREALSQELLGQAVGYASDANLLSLSNMNLLVGLGPYGGGLHTEDEFMDEKSFAEREELNVALIRKILAKKKGNS